MLESPSIPRYLVTSDRTFTMVTTCRVRTISRKDSLSKRFRFTTGCFLSGFALGEGSFMLVCRRRGDYARKWKISAAFNVSQKDRVPLELFRETLGCGTIRKAGNGGWYWEVNRLPESPVASFRSSSGSLSSGKRRPTSSGSGARSRSCRAES